MVEATAIRLEAIPVIDGFCLRSFPIAILIVGTGSVVNVSSPHQAPHQLLLCKVFT